MKPSEYALAHSDEPQPKLLDEEIVTSNWPMPDQRPDLIAKPIPEDSLFARIVRVTWESWRVNAPEWL